MQETWVWSLGWEDPLEEEMAAHSSILVWEIPLTQEPGGVWSMGSQTVRHDWTRIHACMHTWELVLAPSQISRMPYLANTSASSGVESEKRNHTDLIFDYGPPIQLSHEWFELSEWYFLICRMGLIWAPESDTWLNQLKFLKCLEGCLALESSIKCLPIQISKKYLGWLF